jgi:von Willebrand factor type A domain
LTVADLTFLTPAGAVLVLAVALPLAGLLLANRRIAAVRAILGLRAPHGIRAGAVVLPLVAVPALLALAATQPAIRTQEGARVRTDAQVYFVFDTSRSMLASAGPQSPTRLARAKDAALKLRATIPNVPAGVATLTDRALPDLFPAADAATFDSTVRDAVGVERPPPAQTDSTVTTLRPLADVATQGFFGSDIRRPVVVLLTDGEARPDVSPARALLANHVRLVLIHLWHPGERIFDARGKPEAAYRADPNSRGVLTHLAAAVDGREFEERSADDASAAIRAAVGSGPSATRGLRPRTRPLAPYVAAAAFAPLLLVLRRKNIL